MPHRIYTNYKCDTGCHTGYIKITSMASTLPFLASGVTDIMPYRMYTNYKCDTECHTGYIKITSVAHCLQFLAKSQFITDSNASQDKSSPQVSRLISRSLIE